MTAIEIKAEIKKLVDEVPEKSLVEVLTFLKFLKHNYASDNKLSENFYTIVERHRDLVQRLG